MPKLVPVDFDPFATAPEPKLVPVDFDPFASEQNPILREHWGELVPEPEVHQSVSPRTVLQPEPSAQSLPDPIAYTPEQAAERARTWRRNDDYSLGKDLARLPAETNKALVRGAEQTVGAAGSLVEMAGDYMATQSRMWNRLWNESPLGQRIGEQKRKKYIEEHGALPQPAITAGKPLAGEKVSAAGEKFFDYMVGQANTGWEARDQAIYDGKFLDNPSITRVVGGAAESALPMAAAVGLSYAGAPGAGLAVLTASEALPTYTEAKRMGANDGDAFSYALLSGIGTAALERVGINSILGKNPAVNALVEKMGQKWVAGALVNFAVEGSQEAVQEMWQNAVAMGYDGDRKLFDNALEAGLSGGLLGGGSSLGVSIMNDYRQRVADNAKGLTPAQIDAAVRENMRPENAQIQLVRKDGQPTPAPVPGGDVAAPKGQTVQVDVSGQGLMNPAMQQRLVELLNQTQPIPPSPAPSMLAAPQDQVPAAGKMVEQKIEPAAMPRPDFAANREDNAPRLTTTGEAAPISELTAPKLVPVEGNPFAEAPAQPLETPVADVTPAGYGPQEDSGEEKRVLDILGHIAALKGYTKTLLSEKPGAPGPLTGKERAALRRRAERELKALQGEVREIVEEIAREEPIYKEFPVTPDDVKGLMGLNARDATPELYEWFAKQERATKKAILKAAMQGLVDERAARFGRREQVGTKTTMETIRRTVGGEPITKEQIRKRYRELLKEEVARRRLHELEAIKAELEGAIAWWNGTEKMPDYYRKPEEMFADAYSVFINNPQALAKRAPGFFKAMMDYMDARPHVREIYDRLQEDIRSGAIYRNRVKRLHKAFEEGDASMFDRQNAGRQKSATEWLDYVRFSVGAVFGPMEERVRKSGVSDDKAGEIGAAIENYLYRATGHEYYMGRMHQEVVRPLLENDLQWSDLSELMFHNRVVNERHSMANPLGWTPKSSQERLDEMQARMGPQKWAVLDRARSNLWELNGTVRDMIREAGLFTPELLDQIDENIHYATFAVKRDGSTGEPGSIEEMLENNFGTNTGPKIYRQLGTLKQVQDPAAATAMKMLSLMDAARRNVAKTELVDLLRNEFPGEIKAADMRWNGRYQEIVVRESDRAGTIVVMRTGKPEGWYVPKVFVSAFERGNTVENQVLMKMLSAPSRAVKNLYTQLNYGFWPVAFVRDVMAFKAKMPRVSNVPFGGPQFWRHFRRALVDSWSSVMGAPNAGALESLSKQDWITVANPLASKGEGDAIDKLMQRYWQDPANINADRPAIAAVVKAFTKWLELGQVLERTVKRAGRLYLDRNFEDMPEWRKQYIVHNYSGSPNFLRKGALNPVLDFVALFYNPWKESIRSTFGRFKESPATMAWNASKYAVAPKMMMWLFASGAMTAILKELFGDDGEKFGRNVEMMYRYVPEYDKANYTIIPLGWDDRENNKVAYLRLPLAEEMRIPAAMTWKALNGSGDYRQAVNYMGGQLPVGNPLWEVPLAWSQYLSGRNPYDWFRGAPLLDDNVAEARDWRGAAAMGKYTWNTFGGSIIHRFDLQDYGDEKTKTEKFLDLPVVSNAVGRWIKVSNRGLADTLREKVSEPLRREQATSRLDARSALQGGDLDRIGWLMGEDSRAADYIRNNAADIFMRKALTPEQSMIIFAPTVEEREALLNGLMGME